MSFDGAKRPLRAAYDLAAGIRFDGVSAVPGQVFRPRLVHWLLPAAVVAAVVGVSVTLIAGRGPSAPPARPMPAASLTGSHPVGYGSPSPSQATGGRSWRLFVHCGTPLIMFNGRAWAPLAPVQPYPGPRPINGITTDTGYAIGTLVVLSTGRLRFTASNTIAPYVITYAPAPVEPKTSAPVCA